MKLGKNNDFQKNNKYKLSEVSLWKKQFQNNFTEAHQNKMFVWLTQDLLLNS